MDNENRDIVHTEICNIVMGYGIGHMGFQFISLFFLHNLESVHILLNYLVHRCLIVFVNDESMSY